MIATSIRAWLGQITTGAGVMVLAPTLLALLAHQRTAAQAIPALAAGVVGLLWPENGPLAAAVRGATTQLVGAAPVAVAATESIIGAYRAGLTHGMALSVLAPAAGAPAIAGGASPPAVTEGGAH